jgi:type III pantothenate kinase
VRALLIDAGNTRVKWACIETDAGEVLSRGHLLTTEASAERLTEAWCATNAAGAMFVSVASDALNDAISCALETQVPGRFSRFRSMAQVAGLHNAYASPEQLGADRLAAALGAWTRVKGDCLVVNCGTATTIDVVRPIKVADGASAVAVRDAVDLQKKSADATFVGGVILPGLTLMKSALFRNTARLPDADGHFAAIPDNTDDAIETGCRLAQVGAIEAMRGQLPDKAPIVLAGGAAGALHPLLMARGMTIIDAPELVLEGLGVAILHRF